MATRRTSPPALRVSLLEAVADAAKRERRSVRAVVETALERYLGDKATLPAKGNGKRKSPARALHRSGHAGRDLWEALQRAAATAPAAAWKAVPRDGSLDPDRYIYGRP
jgi:hypothetical protein